MFPDRLRLTHGQNVATAVMKGLPDKTSSVPHGSLTSGGDGYTRALGWESAWSVETDHVKEY